MYITGNILNLNGRLHQLATTSGDVNLYKQESALYITNVTLDSGDYGKLVREYEKKNILNNKLLNIDPVQNLDFSNSNNLESIVCEGLILARTYLILRAFSFGQVII